MTFDFKVFWHEYLITWFISNLIFLPKIQDSVFTKFPVPDSTTIIQVLNYFLKIISPRSLKFFRKMFLSTYFIYKLLVININILIWIQGVVSLWHIHYLSSVKVIQKNQLLDTNFIMEANYSVNLFGGLLGVVYRKNIVCITSC